MTLEKSFFPNAFSFYLLESAFGILIPSLAGLLSFSLFCGWKNKEDERKISPKPDKKRKVMFQIMSPPNSSSITFIFYLLVVLPLGVPSRPEPLREALLIMVFSFFFPTTNY